MIIFFFINKYNIIGYPEFIKDVHHLDEIFENLTIRPDTYFDNNVNINAYNFKRELERINEPVNKTTWSKRQYDIKMLKIAYKKKTFRYGTVHGKRLLYFNQEPDGVPGRYSAESLLQFVVSALVELRGHGRGDGARAYARFWRPGAAVR